VLAMEPADLWEAHSEQTGVTEEIFQTYFQGCELGVAIKVTKPRRFGVPVSLAALRNGMPGFTPPQSFRYLTKGEVRDLLGEELGDSGAVVPKCMEIPVDVAQSHPHSRRKPADVPSSLRVAKQRALSESA